MNEVIRILSQGVLLPTRCWSTIRGETMRCASTGVGLYHAIAAQETYKGCVADAKDLGFHEMP
jgi:hypothetical protein